MNSNGGLAGNEGHTSQETESTGSCQLHNKTGIPRHVAGDSGTCFKKEQEAQSDGWLRA